MFYLTKKMLRDLWNMKVQFLAVLLMAFFSVYIYVGLEGVWYGMLDYSKTFLAEQNTADTWIQGYGMTDDDIASIQEIDGIDLVQGVSSLTGEVKKNDENMQLFLMASPENSISLPVVTQGEEYTATDEGIWLFEDFANKNGFTMGDFIKISYQEKSQSFEVTGLTLSPEYLSYLGSSNSILPDHQKYGYGYISPSAMENLSGGQAPLYNQMKIRYEKQWNEKQKKNEKPDQNETREIRNKIENILNSKFLGYFDHSDFKGISSFNDKFIQLRSMTVLFAIILILLSILTMETTMKRMIEIQRIQIGTLKAIGYQDWKIGLHFLFYGFWVSLIGGIAGLLLAPISLSELLLSLQKKFYSVPEWNTHNSMISLILVVAVVLICSFTALFSSLSGMKELPAITMRNEPPKTKKPVFLEKFTGLWKNLSYEWRWTLRVMSRKKMRTIISIVAITGSVILLVDGFGLHSSLNYVNQNLYGKQFDYELRAGLSSTITQEEKTELTELVGTNVQWVQENSVDIRTSKSQTNSVIQIYELGNFTHFNNIEGDRVTLPIDGILLSNGLSESLNIHTNDTIQLRVLGQQDFKTVSVKDIITLPSPQGIFMSDVYWQSLGETFSPNALLTGDVSLENEIKDFSYVNDAIALDTQLEQANEVVSSILVVIIILIVGAFLLSVTILYNLGVLSFTERSREYATLKVIGYRDKEIRSFILHDNLFQLLIGLVFGGVLGYGFLTIHINLASTSSIEYTAHLSPFWFILALTIISAITLTVSAIISKKALKLNMIEVLKSVE